MFGTRLTRRLLLHGAAALLLLVRDGSPPDLLLARSAGRQRPSARSTSFPARRPAATHADLYQPRRSADYLCVPLDRHRQRRHDAEQPHARFGQQHDVDPDHRRRHLAVADRQRHFLPDGGCGQLWRAPERASATVANQCSVSAINMKRRLASAIINFELAATRSPCRLPPSPASACHGLLSRCCRHP
jgi:hypothetical protein